MYEKPEEDIMRQTDNLAVNSIRILSADAIQQANSGHPGLPLGAAPAAFEKACNLENDCVTNRDNELYLVETGFAQGWIRPEIPAFRWVRRRQRTSSGPIT